MPEEPDASRQRFSRDLRRIREDREVTIGEVHEATQIATAQIEALEAGTLYDQSSMNPVYLRAFVREYARAVGLPPEAAAEHLDAALDGSYENQMAEEYLDVPSEVMEKDFSETSAESSDEDLSSEEPAETDSSPETDEASSEEQKVSGPPPEGEEESSDRKDDSSESPAEPLHSEAALVDEDAGRGEGAGESRSRTPPSSSSSARGASSTGSGSPSGDRPSLSPGRTGRFERVVSWFGYNWDVLLTGVSVLLLVGLLVALGISQLSGSRENEASPSDNAGVDQASSGAPSDTSRSTSARPPASLTLGDTVHVTVLATSTVQEMRVQQDDDLRRPYWIEQGEAQVFPFTQRITIENQLDSVRLFLERYPYPTSRTDSLGRIVLDRQSVDAFADTLRGTPATLSVEPDTVALRSPGSE